MGCTDSKDSEISRLG